MTDTNNTATQAAPTVDQLLDQIQSTKELIDALGDYGNPRPHGDEKVKVVVGKLTIDLTDYNDARNTVVGLINALHSRVHTLTTTAAPLLLQRELTRRAAVTPATN